MVESSGITGSDALALTANRGLTIVEGSLIRPLSFKREDTQDEKVTRT